MSARVSRARRNGLALSIVVHTCLVVASTGCANHHTRSPEALREAWREAIEDGDAKATWDLLSPATQRSLDEAAFVAAFERDAAALRADAAASETIRDDDAVRVWTATTVHPGGRRLRWAQDERGRWRVTSGLPGLVDPHDAVAVIRAFVADLRALPTNAGLTWITSELADATKSSLEARAAAIADPDALIVAAEESRAALRYGEGRQLLLVHTDEGWRISRIE
jgi:hypothetical protein